MRVAAMQIAVRLLDNSALRAAHNELTAAEGSFASALRSCNGPQASFGSSATPLQPPQATANAAAPDRPRGARRPAPGAMLPAAATSTANEPVGARIGTIYVNATSNNTICTLVDMRGNPLGWASTGSEGFKNARKQTVTAAQAVAEKIASKSREKGYHSVRLVIKGRGYGKITAVSSLLKADLRVLELHEVTPLPHNGCRPPKKRRP